MRKRILLTFVGLIAIYAVALTASIAITAVHARSYISQLSGEYDKQKITGDSRNLSRDIDRTFALLALPGVRQIAHMAGVDFTPIRDEITAVTSASSWLAGADLPKRYMIAFQNSAEARGTGGILGAFAIIELNKGRLSVIRTGSNAVLYSLKDVPVQVPAEFTKLYGKNPAILQNSNLSPHFPYGAEIWMGLWKKQFGEQLDGVIAVDPSALSYILRATGPITLDSGEIITSENVVAETLQRAYKRYEKDNNARKQYLVDIMNAAAAQITSGKYSRIGMAKALRQGLIENRILIYSRDSQAEAELASVRLGGYLDKRPNNEYRVVIQNIDASKLDYYLKRDVVVQTLACSKTQQTQVRVNLTNTLKSGKGLPAYVLTRADKGKPADLVTGQHRFKLFIYGPTQSILVSASRENKNEPLGGGSSERGRPIYVADVDLAPQESESLLANFAGGIGDKTFVDQPLVIPTKLSMQGGC
jgi:predicted nucleic acid-binding protein